MAEGTLPRTGLTTFGADQDQHPNRVKYNAELQKLEDKVALFVQGATGTRPASGKPGSFFWDETLSKLQYDTGTAWAELINIGGGGVGRDVTPGVAGTEGVSAKGARADHTHNLPLATATVHGAMSSTDKAKLDNATSSSTASRLVIRDAAGRAQFIAPTAGSDAATKSYVDSMNWDGSRITSGTVSADVLPLATASASGIISAADKTKLDNATSSSTASRLVIRDVNGRAQFAEPSAGSDAASKSYVDTRVGTTAPAVHTHAGTDITSQIPAAMIPLATPTTPGAIMAADRNLIDAAGPTAYANTLIKTDANGRYQAAAPSGTNDVANKGYVDTGLALKSNAGHTHPGTDITSAVPAAMLPLATTTTQGALSGADKTKLDDATAMATANKLVVRDASARAQFATPSASADAATKGYVDAGLATKAATSHNHSGAQITSGTVPVAHLPFATPTSSGIMPFGDKAAMDDRTAVATANTIVMRDSEARFNAARPVTAANVANKDYVDDVGLARVTWTEFDNRIVRGSTYSSLRSPDGSKLFTVNNNGIVGSTAIYNYNAATSGQWRAVYVNDSGALGHAVSSRKFKTGEYDYEVPLAVLDDVTPKRFKYIADVDSMGLDAAPENVNFMAEDLHDAGLTEYVSYNGEGTDREHAHSIHPELMVNALWSFAKQQQDLIRGLADRVKALEGN